MLCAVCDETGDGESCAKCGGALKLHARYTLERLLGAGGQSRVYAARDHLAGGEVAIKIMSLARVREWKNVELFRRAASVLGGLHHKGVPRLVEYFEETRPSAALYCLVHELIDGKTLAAAQKEGLRFDDGSARKLLEELCEILGYLHGLSPPVIHRDIKPSNLMRARDGRLMLIDFDLVRDVMMPDGGATTTAGTAGYTPIEQYAGEALPASDIYAAGATMAALLARKEPLTMRIEGEQRLDLPRHVHVGKPLLDVLQKMTEVEVRKRYSDAAEVLADLRRAPERKPSPEQVRAAARPPLFMRMVPLFIVLGTVAFVSFMVLNNPRSRRSSTSSQVTPPIPPVPPTPPSPPRPPSVTAPPPAKPAKPDKPVPAGRLEPAVVQAALVGPTWDGALGDKGVHVQLRFAMRKGKPAAEATTFEGGGRTLHKMSVEISPIGAVTVRGRTMEDGVSVERTFFGELTRDKHGFFGTRETRYDQAGSSYVTEDQFSLTAQP